MTARPLIISLCVAAVMAITTPVSAQYSPGRSSLPLRGQSNDWSSDSVDPLRPVSASGLADFPDLPESLSQLGRSISARPSYDRPLTNRLNLSQNDRGLNWRTDFGLPLDNPATNLSRNSWNGNPGRRELADPFSLPEDLGLDGRLGRDNRLPLNDIRSRMPLDERDPFVPAPLPAGRDDSETRTIDDMITLRYQNPVNVRAVRAMSANQALQLFDEVSRRIDERHLEPSSYDLRIRRGLRNLSIALDNQAFVQSLGIASDSFRTDSFRNSLSSAAGSMQVRSPEEARNVVARIMQQAQGVSGLTPSVVAFEFANASMDTLDKFSGLEPSDPQGIPGASLEAGTKSAALEEEIVGVGVEVKEHELGLLVVKALRGGPAAEAGLESGDVIIAINGRSIGGLKMVNSTDLMKGSSGSSLTIRIFRDGRGERDFALTRRKVRVWTVNDTRILQGTSTAYLSLSRFSQNSTAELDQALAELYQKGMKSLIIDLRGNPGGLLTTCVEISDRFVPCGTIVSTRGRLDSDNMLEKASWQKTWSTPLVMLIDGDSASASEIFAAAVQENQRGVVVGSRSYGKGTVQTHFPLRSISGNLRLTTARFYSPSGRPMAGEGVTPDVVVEDQDGLQNGDLVLERAVQIAASSRLAEMARAAGTCRTGSPAAARSTSLKQFNDPVHSTTTVQ